MGRQEIAALRKSRKISDCDQVVRDYTSVWQWAGFMKILVPVDGSPASVRAVKLAVDQVKALPEASLVLLNVQNFSGLSLPEGAGIMPSTWIEQEEQRAAAEALREAVIICREAGISYVTRTERGGVAATIDRVSRYEHVQHIFMGTRGLGGVRWSAPWVGGYSVAASCRCTGDACEIGSSKVTDFLGPLVRLGLHIPTASRENAGVHHSKINRQMAEMGQARHIGAVSTLVECPLRLQYRPN
jgi:nucleotide-binding universal stress UspA family protein